MRYNALVAAIDPPNLNVWFVWDDHLGVRQATFHSYQTTLTALGQMPAEGDVVVVSTHADGFITIEGYAL